MTAVNSDSALFSHGCRARASWLPREAWRPIPDLGWLLHATPNAYHGLRITEGLLRVFQGHAEESLREITAIAGKGAPSEQRV